jgi:hypothetical protein
LLSGRVRTLSQFKSIHDHARAPFFREKIALAAKKRIAFPSYPISQRPLIALPLSPISVRFCIGDNKKENRRRKRTKELASRSRN